MKTTIIMNGVNCLIIQPENEIEKEFIRKLNGGTVSLVQQNMSILHNNIEGSIIVTEGTPKNINKNQ